MECAIGIVAHTNRSSMAEDLAGQVDADYMSIDNGALGPNRNHHHVWSELVDSKQQWVCVLEDDAQPIKDFRTQLHQALTAAPTPVVSLYLGTGNPPQWQHRIKHATIHADKANAAWITTNRLLYGVAVCTYTSLIPAMLASIERDQQISPLLPFDQAARNWASRIGFTWPSLVDHADTPTLINHPDGSPRTQPRRAWRVGGRDRWTQRTVAL